MGKPKVSETTVTAKDQIILDSTGARKRVVANATGKTQRELNLEDQIKTMTLELQVNVGRSLEIFKARAKLMKEWYNIVAPRFRELQTGKTRKTFAINIPRLNSYMLKNLGFSYTTYTRMQAIATTFKESYMETAKALASKSHSYAEQLIGKASDSKVVKGELKKAYIAVRKEAEPSWTPPKHTKRGKTKGHEEEEKLTPIQELIKANNHLITLTRQPESIAKELAKEHTVLNRITSMIEKLQILEKFITQAMAERDAKSS